MAAEDKRQQILSAAVRVFAAQGYEATRVGDIAPVLLLTRTAAWGQECPECGSGAV